MFDHIDEARRRERSERSWQLSSLWSVMGGSQSRKKLQESIRQIDVRSWRASPSVYDDQDDETRLLMIGAALNGHILKPDYSTGIVDEGSARERLVAGWMESHPHEAEWLTSIGCTATDARRRHEEWLERTEQAICQQSHVGLTPGAQL